MICPSCFHDNIGGADQCKKCGLSLMQEDTNPEYTAGKSARIISDPIYRASLSNAVVVSPSATVKSTLAKMVEARQNCALIVDRREVVGIFTERDSLQKITSPNIDLGEMEIHLLMTRMPEVLNETDSISYAFNKMAMGNFRHIPIRKRDGTYTVFSARDALSYLF